MENVGDFDTYIQIDNTINRTSHSLHIWFYKRETTWEIVLSIEMCMRQNGELPRVETTFNILSVTYVDKEC